MVLCVLSTGHEMQKFLYSLIGLILVLIIAVLFLWRFIHTRHKQKMVVLSVKERMLSQGSGAELNVSQMGDNTLQVNDYYTCHCGALWLSGRFGALRPKGRKFESHSSRYVEPLSSPSLAVACCVSAC